MHEPTLSRQVLNIFSYSKVHLLNFLRSFQPHIIPTVFYHTYIFHKYVKCSSFRPLKKTPHFKRERASSILYFSLYMMVECQINFSLCFSFPYFRFNHGSCAECCGLLLPYAVCIPYIVAWGRGPAADYQPVSSDKPRCCSPVPGPGSHQLLFYLWPQSEETPALFRGMKPVSHLV